VQASAHHHPGLRVSDIERAAKFYIDAFDGHFMVCPFTIAGDFAEVVMDGPPGVSFKVAMVGFAHGCVELFEFVDPVHPIDPVHPTKGNIIHIGIQVDDVAEALARVEAAGGKRLWPDINPWGSANVIYVLDPDQNILEITDASMAEIVRLTLEAFPEADPAKREASA
jgi:catechol 2,3-dioxygenase-like lactoylglutathione lyase family enzyme